MGHLYRLISLAEMIKENYLCIFLLNKHCPNIIPSHFQVYQLPDNILCQDEPSWIFQKFDAESSIIVIDGGCFNVNYQKSIKGYGFTLFYVFDLPERHFIADVVINHAPNFENETLQPEPHIASCLGSKYLILRDEFICLIEKEFVLKPKREVFICFGGSDPFDFSLMALRACLMVDFITTINLVVGELNQNDLSKIRNNAGKNIKVHTSLNSIELIDVMSNCGFAIVPSSTICLELISVKKPIIAGYYVENQRYIYNGLLNSNCIIGAGDLRLYDSLSLSQFISDKISNVDLIEMMQNQKLLFDGGSKKRFVNIFNEYAKN